MKYDLLVFISPDLQIWISAGPTLRAGRRREGRGGTEGTRKGGKNSPCFPKHGGRSTPMLLLQQILLASESSLVPGCEWDITKLRSSTFTLITRYN